MKIKIIGIDGEFVEGLIQVAPSKVKVPISELINYIQEKGFEKNGEWYFRTSWMDSTHSRLFEKAGLIKKIGTSADLRKKGVEYPHDGRGTSISLFYQLTNEKIKSILNN